MKHFELKEFTRSSIADELLIKNIPEQWQIDNCEEMVKNLLDPLREAWAIRCANEQLGTPAIRISSGIRSRALNDHPKVGGSKTSSHYYGYAADLVPLNYRYADFKDFCRKWLSGRKFDQMISEKENVKGVPQWIHLGYKRYDGSQRKQYLSNVGDKYFPMT